jgi:hypothetical protein
MQFETGLLPWPYVLHDTTIVGAPEGEFISGAVATLKVAGIAVAATVGDGVAQAAKTAPPTTHASTCTFFI